MHKQWFNQKKKKGDTEIKKEASRERKKERKWVTGKAERRRFKKIVERAVRQASSFGDRR